MAVYQAYTWHRTTFRLTAVKQLWGSVSDSPDSIKVDLLWVGLLVEGGMLVLALLISLTGFFDSTQPLYELQWTDCQNAVVIGTLATIPMLLFMAVIELWDLKLFRSMRQILDEKLKPLFENCSLFELFLLSVMAGVGEELLFRWCLQGGISSWLDSVIGTLAAVIVGTCIASLLFGLCHWVNSAYGIITLLIGLYLGYLMVHTGSWLVPAFAHALYDFIALLYIVKKNPRPANNRFGEKESGPGEEQVDSISQENILGPETQKPAE